MSKYNSKQVVIDNITFDSKMESEYYLLLKERLANGEIAGFGCHPSYELIPSYTDNGKKVRPMTYSADFVIYHLNETVEVIDIKGYPSEASEIKKKFFGWKFSGTKLTWITYVKKYGGWIDLDDLKAQRRNAKKVV